MSVTGWMIEITKVLMALMGVVLLLGVIVPLVLGLAFLATAAFCLHLVLMDLVPAYRRHVTGGADGQSHV